MAKQIRTNRPRKVKTKLHDLNRSIEEAVVADESVRSPHGLIRNKLRKVTSVGSIGGYMKDEFDDIYGLTCFHVTKHNTADWNNIAQGESIDIVNNSGTPIGKLEGFNKLNNKIDVSFVKINDPTGISNQFINNPKDFYNIDDDDVKKLEVQLYSDIQKKIVTGYVVKAYKNDEITLILKENGEENKFVDLIAISTALDNGKSLTQDGDSGAWVRRKSDNKLIGIVIGNDFHKEVTYVIKIKNILDHCKDYKLF